MKPLPAQVKSIMQNLGFIIPGTKKIGCSQEMPAFYGHYCHQEKHYLPSPVSFTSFWILTIVLLLLTPLLPLSAQPTIQWNKTLGSDNIENLLSVLQTRDGGYILGGWSISGIGGDKSQNTRGASDYWVVKLDSAGNKEWDKTYGGDNWDHLTSLQQTTDGGYILGGYSASGISGDKSEAKRGRVEDFWVVKLDASGNKEWDRTYGGIEGDYLNALQQTSDGGYILGGTSYSGISGDKTEPRRGDCNTGLGCLPDFWVVKLDASGNKEWDKTFGGTGLDGLSSLRQANDGGYILGGNSDSGISGDKSADNWGNWDFWVVKLNATGVKEWDKSLGGDDRDALHSLQETKDGGYILGGESRSDISGNKSESNQGREDYWVVKLDASGHKEWDKTLGGNEGDILNSLHQTKDEGYLLGGSSNSDSSEYKTGKSQGGSDFWIVKLDATGNQLWDKTIGGTGEDKLAKLEQTSNEGYILGGTSDSGMGADKTETSRGFDDYWVVKLAPFPDAGKVVGFTLINSQNEQPIRSLQDGDEINLAILPNKGLNIRADTHPAMLGSVKFELSGPQDKTQVENEVPYALFGDVNGNFNQWNFLPGSYTLTATPYAKEASRGTAGIPLTIRFTVVQSQFPPQVEWDKTIGGNSLEQLRYLQQTKDGGYILAGHSGSDVSGDKSEDANGLDIWLVKLDSSGNKEWDKTIGGNKEDRLSSLLPTADGGYILGGYSNSDAGIDKSENSKGSTDFWLIKVDASGNKEWDKTIGGDNSDILQSCRQIADGGYILAGTSVSNSGEDKSEDSKGGTDFWLVKLDASGNKEWDKTIGGDESDNLQAMEQTTGGGYILGGWSGSSASGDKSEDAKGNSDYWVIKIDSAGNKEWDKTLGGKLDDILYSLQQTNDSGYILGGYSVSEAGFDKSENSKGSADYWVVKLDAAGSKKWDKTIGGNFDDLLFSLKQTLDNGYMLGGYSFSNPGEDKSEPAKGSLDYWVVKIDTVGNKEWDKTIGGNNEDHLTSLHQTTDKGYILGGYSLSNASGDKSENSKGSWDYWIVKLKGEVSGPCHLALTTQVTQAEPWYGMWGYAAGAGAIDLTVSGGTAPYAYRWNAGVNTQDIPVALPGHYSVTVTDAQGCTATTHVYVGQKNDFLRVSSSHTHVSVAGGQDGSIDLTVVGGVVPATFQWSNGATTEDLTHLSAGTYSVVVTDAFGRKATTTVVISVPGTPLSLSFAQQQVSAAGKLDGSVDLTVVGGVGPYTYRWNTGAVTEDLYYATPGLYTVTVTDATGATASVEVEVGRTPMLLARNPKAGEDLVAASTGLTTYPNPAAERTTVNFSIKVPGQYTLDLYDIRGAKVKTLAIGQAQANQAITVEVNVADYAKGNYLLQLQTNQGVSSSRLMIDR